MYVHVVCTFGYKILGENYEIVDDKQTISLLKMFYYWQ